MSELTEYTNPEKLHALWHNFQPSPRLEEAVGIFTGSEVRPSFFLKATRAVIVDSAGLINSEYHLEEMKAKEVVKRAKDIQFILGSVAAWMLFSPTNASDKKHPDGLRLAFEVVEPQQSRLNKLEESLSVFPEVIAHNGFARMHKLYLDVPMPTIYEMGIKTTRENFAHLKQNVRDSVQLRRYSATIDGLIGSDISRSEIWRHDIVLPDPVEINV